MVKKKKDVAENDVTTQAKKEPEISPSTSSMSSFQTVQSMMVPKPAAGSIGKRIGIFLGIAIGLGGAGYFSYSSGYLDSLIPSGDQTAETGSPEGTEKSAADMPPTAPVTDKDLDSLNPEATKAADTEVAKPATDVIEQKAAEEAPKAALDAPKTSLTGDAPKAALDAPKASLTGQAPKAAEKPAAKSALKKVDSKKATAKKKTATKKKVAKTKAKTTTKAKPKKTAAKQ